MAPRWPSRERSTGWICSAGLTAGLLLPPSGLLAGETFALVAGTLLAAVVAVGILAVDDKRPAMVPAAIVGGVLRTGDKGAIDGEGLLHVQGRLKDVLELPGGTKVFLPEYEAAIAAALSERDAAVVLHQGKLTLACGQLTNERTEREIMKAIEPALAAFPPASRIGKVVRLGHALPRTAAGDVERWKIQEELEHGNC